MFVNGTATTNATFTLMNFTFVKNEVYTITNGLTNNAYNKYSLFIPSYSYWDTNTFITGSYETFTPKTTIELAVQIIVYAGQTMNNVKFYPKLQKGTVATKWSPYNYGTIEIISKNGEQQSSNICYIKNGLVQGDYIDYSKKKVVRANGTQEDIDCSDKIVQYADSTTVYNTDGAEIEVSLTNNKAISEVNENLDRIEKKVNEINILTAELKEDVTINASSSARADNIALNELTRIGNKLSISDGGIKIGKDVNHILVSGNIRIKSNTASKRAGIQVARNLQTSDRFKFLASNIMYLSAANSTYGISSSSILIDVKENDVLYLNCYMDASATYVLSSAFCNLTVQVVD